MSNFNNLAAWYNGVGQGGHEPNQEQLLRVFRAHQAALQQRRFARHERADYVEANGYAADPKCSACKDKISGDTRCLITGPGTKCHCCVRQSKTCSFASFQALLAQATAQIPQPAEPVMQPAAVHPGLLTSHPEPITEYAFFAQPWVNPYDKAPVAGPSNSNPSYEAAGSEATSDTNQSDEDDWYHVYKPE
ncbi:hypothetical protein HD553DRAFT_324634 [Filobasidium floriforme]|uniref:uncharacterized protein n=1 Tax=Filobasidium floriforme TaxID=5210 RepID=UPI001E8CB5EB|nr:uncharacterized protein HD553DRAFT_324634 [Filobasidium floriforme]KAH8083041.1 hypothetical protein HD553DRAFT_324634 [Filobasidium floriforme]